MDTLFELLESTAAPKPKTQSIKYFLYYETEEGRFIYWKKLRRGYSYGSKWLQPHELTHGRKCKKYNTLGIADYQRSQLQKHLPDDLPIKIGRWDIETNEPLF